MPYLLRTTKYRLLTKIKQYMERMNELNAYQEEEGDCPCAGRVIDTLMFHIIQMEQMIKDIELK